MKQLTDDQIKEYQIANDRKRIYQEAKEVTIQALNKMKREGEQNIIEPEDIYPEVWNVLMKETIEAIDEHERSLYLRMKDIIKRTAISEASNPIVKKINRPKRKEGDNTLFTDYDSFPMNPSLEGDPEEIIGKAICNSVSNDQNDVYKDIDTEQLKINLINNELFYNSVKDRFISCEAIDSVLTEIGVEYGQYSVIDIIENIFTISSTELYDTLTMVKYGYINSEVQKQILAEAQKEIEANTGKDILTEESTEDNSDK